jgi:hypothetical protein
VGVDVGLGLVVFFANFVELDLEKGTPSILAHKYDSEE